MERLLAERHQFLSSSYPESLITEFSNRKWTLINVNTNSGFHWRVFAVLLVRIYRIEIDFDDSIRWRSRRSVLIDINLK